jgi:hypothetical protein
MAPDWALLSAGRDHPDRPAHPAQTSQGGDPAEVAGWESARAVADAVLYEGYLLYPYRRSSPKNRVRWQFGVLAPREWVEAQRPVKETVAGSVDAWQQRTECLLEAKPCARLWVRLRFLQPQRRSVQVSATDGEFVEVDELELGGERHLTFGEAVPREVDVALAPGELGGCEHIELVTLPGGEEIEPLGDASRVVRRRWPLSARLRLSIVDATAPFPLRRLRVIVENTVRDQAVDATRAEVLRRSLVAAHCVLAVQDAKFLSLLEPPKWASEAAEECRNLHTFPVLAGMAGERDVMLSSPIIMYDHPGVAPESPGDLFDAGEIDEILSLRTLTLTDEEKREARATDPRAKAIVDRVDALPKEVFARLHGAVRSLQPVADEGAPPEPGWEPAADHRVSPDADAVSSTGFASPAAAESGWSRGVRAPTPTTCSSGTAPRGSRRCSWTSMAIGTWPWCWRTIPARTCTSGTAGTATSRRRNWYRSKVGWGPDELVAVLAREGAE